MDRRSFLTSWAKSPGAVAFNQPSSQSNNQPLLTGLEAWVPTTTDPWDNIRAGHLLRRTMMMPVWSDLTKIAAMTPSDAVDLLLNTPSNPAPPSIAGKVTHSLHGLDTIKTNQQKGEWAGDDGVLQGWYAGVLMNSPLSIIEKMTFFWSGHFTSQFVASDSYVVAPLLYNQNVLFRNNALGNFHNLTFDVTLDGAMLVYLGGILNTKSKANENYARELMELFTMGLGNYTEGDVKEAARILTGWRVAQFSDEPDPNGPLTTYFSPTDHDTSNKTYLGVTFSAIDPNSENTEDLVKKNEIQKLIDTIFSVRQQVVARFICTKIYRFFIYSNAAATDANVVSQMAALLIQNNFEIKPVISALLKSAHFFDNANIGCQIKTPAEYIIGIGRQLGYSVNMAGNMATILQELFNPPNVSGWTGWHDWITTNTYPVRSTIAVGGPGITGAIASMDILKFINQFPTASTDGSQLITDIGALMLPRKLSQDRHDALAQILVGSGGKIYEWPTIFTTNQSTALLNMRNVLTTIVELPDYQLC